MRGTPPQEEDYPPSWGGVAPPQALWGLFSLCISWLQEKEPKLHFLESVHMLNGTRFVVPCILWDSIKLGPVLSCKGNFVTNVIISAFSWSCLAWREDTWTFIGIIVTYCNFGSFSCNHDAKWKEASWGGWHAPLMRGAVLLLSSPPYERVSRTDFSFVYHNWISVWGNPLISRGAGL